MTSKYILEKYIEFYKKRDHKQVPNVSLVPEGDSTLLYVNSGMFPLVPYLSGEPHPLGKRLVNVQRALRFFEDLENVGRTNRHTTAFHMLGNWSLGDYFKKEQLHWAYEFFIEVLGLDPKRIFSTVFEGDKNAPKDLESIDVIKEIFNKYGIQAKENERIFAYGKEDNWWQRGDAVGELGGPDSETFYYVGEGDPPIGKSPSKFPNDFLEIGNSVFMQYKKTEHGWKELPSKNVDFGGGLERMAMVVQNKKDIYETDNFWPLIEKIQEITEKNYFNDQTAQRNMRVLADHMRASVFLAMDGVTPSNKEQGYILRRLIRRMVRAGKILDAKKNLSSSLVGTVVEMFSWLYTDLPQKQKNIEDTFVEEETKFKKTLDKGMQEVSKILSKNKSIDEHKAALLAFDLYQSIGYPSEIFFRDLEDFEIKLDESEFDKVFKEIFNEHQQKSRLGAEKKFKGGLADQSDTVVKYHTVTHLMHKALKTVLGEHITQLGSNITNERLRFDFPNPKKLTDEEIQSVVDIVNDAVSKALPVTFVTLDKEDAIKAGASYLKGESYPDVVKVYYIGDSLDWAFSKELCGGPHVQNTNELFPVEIYKQEGIGEGRFRLYARFKKPS